MLKIHIFQPGLPPVKLPLCPGASCCSWGQIEIQTVLSITTLSQHYCTEWKESRLPLSAPVTPPDGVFLLIPFCFPLSYRCASCLR